MNVSLRFAVMIVYCISIFNFAMKREIIVVRLLLLTCCSLSSVSAHGVELLPSPCADRSVWLAKKCSVVKQLIGSRCRLGW